jgi:zinc protease
MKILLSLLILVGFNQSAQAYERSNIKKLNWENLEVVWLKDERFPTYSLSIYFADGALSDSSSRIGETNMMFGELFSGTNRYGQKEISDNLEYYGVSFDTDVTHEYSSFSMSGLVKDIIPTMKMVCHLFNDAIFPKKELNKSKKRAINGLQSLVTNPGALAQRAFRNLSLANTTFELPPEGTIKTIKKINHKHLEKKLKYFVNDVKKRIYISGPEKSLVIKDIINKECNFNNFEATYVRKPKYSEGKKQLNPKIYFVTVPKANQVQLRIGRFINKSEFPQDEILSVASSYLGGGFTSKLMSELRTKRGLTYSAGAFAGMQKSYGRGGIATSTRSQSALEALEVIRNTIRETSNSIPETEYKQIISRLAGSYLFQFEKTSALLGNFMFLDHTGESYDKLFNYPKMLQSFSSSDAAKAIGELYNWDKQTIVVVGSKTSEYTTKDGKKKKVNVVNELKKLGPVKVVSYKDFL